LFFPTKEITGASPRWPRSRASRLAGYRFTGGAGVDALWVVWATRRAHVLDPIFRDASGDGVIHDPAQQTQLQDFFKQKRIISNGTNPERGGSPSYTAKVVVTLSFGVWIFLISLTHKFRGRRAATGRKERMPPETRETKFCFWLLNRFRLRYLLPQLSTGRFQVDKVGRVPGEKTCRNPGRRNDELICKCFEGYAPSGRQQKQLRRAKVRRRGADESGPPSFVYIVDKNFPEGPPPRNYEYVRMGVTIWRLSPSQCPILDCPLPKESVHSSKGLVDTATRVDDNVPLNNGERVRLGMESLAQSGYVYIIDREQSPMVHWAKGL